MCSGNDLVTSDISLGGIDVPLLVLHTSMVAGLGEGEDNASPLQHSPRGDTLNVLDLELSHKLPWPTVSVNHNYCCKTNSKVSVTHLRVLSITRDILAKDKLLLKFKTQLRMTCK